jgi:hypothetical protein
LNVPFLAKETVRGGVCQFDSEEFVQIPKILHFLVFGVCHEDHDEVFGFWFLIMKMLC